VIWAVSLGLLWLLCLVAVLALVGANGRDDGL
jgi:hypothetical protein